MNENMLLEILTHGRIDPPPYIVNVEYRPEKREAELLEDSDFMFLTKRHPDHIFPGLKSSPKEMAKLWRKAGRIDRFTVFQNMVQKNLKPKTKEK